VFFPLRVNILLLTLIVMGLEEFILPLEIKKRVDWYKARVTKKIHDFLLWVDGRTEKSKIILAFPVCYLNYQLFDNARPIFESIKNNPNITKIILYHGNSRPKIKGKKVYVVRLNSVLGLWWLFRSGVIFVRHCVIQDVGIPVVNSSRLVVNLFHGIALKNIGIQVSPDSITGCDPFGAIISSSVADKKTMLSSFKSSNTENVWITGLPRNDLLFCSRNHLWPGAKDELDRIEARLSGKKLILFAPTFRANWESWGDKGGFYKFSRDELVELDDLAKKFGAVIGIRTHIREERSVLEAFDGLDVLVFNDIIEPSLILKMTDILISDYSSIMVDFLLMRRPVLSFAFDYDVYKQGKGFLYDLEKVLPTPLCFTFDDLMLRLESALDYKGGDDMSEEYRQAVELFHNFSDGQSTHRVIKKIESTLDIQVIN
jgi:CDP-glycerol glycerophosphotransferase